MKFNPNLERDLCWLGEARKASLTKTMVVRRAIARHANDLLSDLEPPRHRASQSKPARKVFRQKAKKR